MININNITKNTVVNIITKHGWDYTTIELALDSKRVNEMLKQIGTQSVRLLLTGVPAFIINDKIYAGISNLGDVIKLLDTNLGN